MGKLSIQRPMWFKAGIWTFGLFLGSKGDIKSISIVPKIPFPKVSTSSSTFSDWEVKELIFFKPRVYTQKF